MATISISSDLEVADKYETLVKQSLDGNSVYIRAKETIQDLVDTGAIDNSQKAEVISGILSGVVSNIATASMQTALAWAQSEKETALKKLELAIQLDILEQQALLAEAQVEQTYNAIRLAKVESKRMYGTPVYVDNDVASLGNDGKIYTDILLTEAQELKVDAETTLTTQKMQESYAAVHKIVADTYVNYGNYTFAGLDTDGIDTVTAQHGDYETLSDMQREIAEEQAKGYTYNAWANALTGTASMLGTAIAAEYSEFEDGSTGGDLLDILLETATNLSNATTTTSEASPA